MDFEYACSVNKLKQANKTTILVAFFPDYMVIHVVVSKNTFGE